MTLLTRLSVVCALLFTSACASNLNSHLEEARFELDARNYTNAINEASNALDDDPGNIEASRILANAYFGRSGLNFLDLAEAILSLSDDTDNNFSVIAESIPETTDADDLRSAIDALESLTGADDATIDDEDLADAVFDLGLMQIIEHYAIGVLQSGYPDAFDVTGITNEGSEIVESDLVAFDNRLIASGISADEDFIIETRQTFCILEPISAGAGFTTAEYQALVGCQLADEPETFDTTALTADIADCDALNPDTQSDDIQSCYNSNTAL